MDGTVIPESLRMPCPSNRLQGTEQLNLAISGSRNDGGFMRAIRYAFIPAILFFAGSALCQISQGSHFPYKDLIFPQIAAGGQYQTWITVTNKGTQPWQGTFHFYTGRKDPWNPYVNGIQLSGGSLAVTIPSKATRTFKVTLPGGTEGGYLIARAGNTNLDNFLEGNLTYYVSSDESILDSVGIMPSNPALAAVMPFEDFSAICFGFVNPDGQGRTATVTLTLYSDANAQVDAPATITLSEGDYLAQYLWQTFPSAPQDSWRGRVEIQSNVPVSGVALTQVTGGQLSSLPLNATVRNYSLVTSSTYVPFGGMTFWTEGLFINGYLVGSTSNVYGLFGQVDSDNTLELHYEAITPGLGVEVIGFFKSDGPYTPGQSTVTGTFKTYIPTLSSYKTGTFTATLIP
jgi:hypothetical protein